MQPVGPVTVESEGNDGCSEKRVPDSQKTLGKLVWGCNYVDLNILDWF